MSIKLNSALGGSVTLNEPATASAFTLTLPTDNIQPGMNLITPTSVVGGTFSGGNISFSAATSVSINGCFTSTYANYYLIFGGMLGSAAVSSFMLRMRANGTDDTSSNYIFGQSYALYSGTLGGAGSTGTTSFANWGIFVNAAKRGILMTLTSPQLSEATGFYMQGVRHDAADTQGGLHNVSSAFDGFTFATTNSTTVTGTVKIYGMRNQ